MALLLSDLQWADEPLIPRVNDAAWEKEVVQLMGVVPDAMLRVAASHWVRQAYLYGPATTIASLSGIEVMLANLVTSQENACRYCYGVSRARLRMMGYGEESIDRIERRAHLADA